MSCETKQVIGYTISVDNINWLKLSPFEYFYTKDVAIRYGKQNYFSIMKNCGLVPTPGNPGILYIAPALAIINKEAMAFSYDMQKPLTPVEMAEIKHTTDIFNYHEQLIKQQNPTTNTDFEKVLNDEVLRIRKRCQQSAQRPTFISLGKAEVLHFNPGE